MRAGFEVTGVDIKDHSQNFPGCFIKGDALAYLETYGKNFDAIHASPPCQGYSKKVKTCSSKYSLTKGKDEPRLIRATRERLKATGRPWIMENVMGSREVLQGSLLLCGVMFNLPTSRHRLFESSELIPQPIHPKCRGVAKRYAADKGWNWRDMSVTGKGRRAGTTERWREVLDVKHTMTQSELAECIPPAYTEYIGKILISFFKRRCDEIEKHTVK